MRQGPTIDRITFPPSPHRMVECIHCGREMHKICVLHHENIWTEGFQCDSCLRAKRTVPKGNKFSAERKLCSCADVHMHTWVDMHNHRYAVGIKLLEYFVALNYFHDNGYLSD